MIKRISISVDGLHFVALIHTHTTDKTTTYFLFSSYLLDLFLVLLERETERAYQKSSIINGSKNNCFPSTVKTDGHYRIAGVK
jgi:hypothetical protein